MAIRKTSEGCINSAEAIERSRARINARKMEKSTRLTEKNGIKVSRIRYLSSITVSHQESQQVLSHCHSHRRPAQSELIRLQLP